MNSVLAIIIQKWESEEWYIIHGVNLLCICNEKQCKWKLEKKKKTEQQQQKPLLCL